MVLQRVPDIRLQIDSNNKIGVLLDDESYYFGPHGLAILDAFSQPVSVAEVLKKLGTTTTGAQDWIALTTTIMQLYEAGVLQDVERKRGPRLEIGKRSFGATYAHVRMLNDRTRTSSFLAGVAEVVTPGDVVVDVGTGTGVLAIAAARAGANHVYAIEATAIGEVAKTIFEDNGLADRITLLRGWSTRINLPERADVFVSETIGSKPLDESVLMIKDALKRLLKPEARLIPNKIRIFGLPVTIPPSELTKRHVLTKHTLQGILQSWRSWYGIDFQSLAGAIRHSSPTFYVEPREASGWEALSEPILMAEIGLREVERLAINNSVTVAANTSGQLNGLVIYFELDVGPSTYLTTHPTRAGKDCSWNNVVWILDPLSLRTYDQFNVTYQYRATPTPLSVAVTRV
jgi:protein arginine N-methyltransferase 1